MRILLGLVALFILSCSSGESLTGSGTGVGNGYAVKGEILQSDSAFASGTSVILANERYLPVDSVAQKSDLLFSTLSDTNGRFSMTGIDSGSYLLWGTAPNGERIKREVYIGGSDSLIILDSLLLSSPDTFTISYLGEDDDGKATIQFYGSDIFYSLDAPGFYSFPLPEGVHVVKCDYETQKISVDTVLLQSDDTLILQAIDDNVISNSYQTDSLIISYFFEINGMNGSNVKDVSTAIVDDDTNIKRLYSLTFRGIDTLTGAIGALTEIESLTVSDGNLTKLPDRIGSCDDLKYLDLSNNKLEELPLSLLYLDNLDSINLKGNPLTMLSDTLKMWLNDL